MGLEHRHYMVRAEVADPIKKPKQAKKWLKKLVKAIGMKICKHGGPHVDYVDKPDNCGIAAVVMIETSHIALHVWDKLEKPLVQLDIYSCAPFDCNVVNSFLNEMRPTRRHTWLVDRADRLRLWEEMEDLGAVVSTRNLK